LRLIRFDPDENISQENNSFIIIAKKDVDYKLSFEDENGCIIEKILRVRARRDDGIYFPTVFSPNNDQQNDIWGPVLGSSMTLKSISIFERWGNRLFYSDKSREWDGTSDGRLVNPGVYVYLIQVTDSEGKDRQYYGNLTLIR